MRPSLLHIVAMCLSLPLAAAFSSLPSPIAGSRRPTTGTGAPVPSASASAGPRRSGGRVCRSQHAERATPEPAEDSCRRWRDGGGSSLVAATALALSVALGAAPVPAAAYRPTDYASDAVVAAVESLRSAGGDADRTFQTYETVGAIITEGRGVGGALSYRGVELERGYVADEDTSVYNPGLTLLTESEKERLVEAVVESRQAGLAKGQWDERNQRAFEFLRDKLDPLHVTELRGYLAIFPFYTAAVYLAALAVQQFARGLFPVAYLVGVAAIVAPILVLIAAGQ